MPGKFIPNDEDQRRRLQDYIFSLEDSFETVEALSIEHQRLKHSMEILLIVLEGSVHGIVLIRGNKFMWLNQGFITILGWTSEDLLGKGLEQLFSNKVEFVQVRDCLLSELQKKNLVDWRYEFPRKDGTRVACSLSGRLVDENDFSKGFILTFTDITEKIRAEQLMIQNERTNAIIELSNGVAHNFNNLLQIIVGNCELAKTRMQDVSGSVQISRYLDQIVESARHGSQTVKRLQNFSRIETENSMVGADDTDLSELARDALSMTKSLWQSTRQGSFCNLSIVTEFCESCIINCRKNEIFEVIINLLKNSVEAMPQGGSLFVKTCVERDKALLEIRDTGNGIKKEDLSKVFLPFWTTKGFLGSGLGLASSYGIVQRHDGAINIRSDYGIGTVVSVVFPLSSSASSELEDVQPEATPNKLRVLLIDDVQEVLVSLKEMLCDSCESVLTALSGQEGIGILKSDPIDLIICDLGMPGMNGVQVASMAQEISSAKAEERPKFILLTGWDVPEGQFSEQEFSAIDLILQKPVSPSRLMAEISSLTAEKPGLSKKSRNSTG